MFFADATTYSRAAGALEVFFADATTYSRAAGALEVFAADWRAVIHYRTAISSEPSTTSKTY
ncbi:hypothetical protein EXE40_08055 [Halorubrum sp. GN11GM_10-3_MGM]|nr:hypothetical protein EXE40_08055 [Halorubrum sp. GN11GM_10-3_MGM]